MIKLFYTILIFFITINAFAKIPIYALDDGWIKSEIEWENANDINTEVMDFQKYYKECMKDEFSVIKNENFCVNSISLSFFPQNDECIIFYYEVSFVIGENKNHFVEKSVKKGELIAYTNTKERTKPTIRKRNFRGCK